MNSKEKTLYTILGVSQDATLEEIKKSFKKLVIQIHPDKVDDTKKEDAHIKFQELRAAYETLRDHEERAKYDQELKYGQTKENFASYTRGENTSSSKSNFGSDLHKFDYRAFYASEVDSIFDDLERKYTRTKNEKVLKPKGGLSW